MDIQLPAQFNTPPSPTLSPSTPSSPPNLSNFKKPKILILLVLFGLIVIALTFYLSKNPAILKLKEQAIGDNSPQTKTYDNKNLGFSFTYPDNWKITESSLLKGSSLPKGNFNITALDGDLEIITLKNNSYELIIEAQKQFQKEICDGVATSVWEYGFPIYYKKIKILDREAVREPIEEGEIPAYIQQTEPYRLPIMFKRLQGEYPRMGSFKDFPNAALFCLEKADKPLKIKVTYFSPQFTKQNIIDKTLDKNSLREMDIIVSSIKLN